MGQVSLTRPDPFDPFKSQFQVGVDGMRRCYPGAVHDPGIDTLQGLERRLIQPDDVG